VTLVQTLADAVASMAPRIAVASPTGAAVSGAVVYALVHLATRNSERSSGTR
jgi:hypothetical protein